MNLYFAALLILPVVALGAKGLGKLKMSVWAIFFIYLAIGWLLVHLVVQSSTAALNELIQNTPNPSKELLNEWQNDTGRSFASIAGLVYPTVYFSICLPVLYLVRFVKRMQEED